MSADVRPGRAVLGVRWCRWPVAVVAVTVAVTFASSARRQQGPGGHRFQHRLPSPRPVVSIRVAGWPGWFRATPAQPKSLGVTCQLLSLRLMVSAEFSMDCPYIPHNVLGSGRVAASRPSNQESQHASFDLFRI